MANEETVLETGHHVVWSNRPQDRAGTDLVILLHGYGSNEHRMAESCFPMLPESTTGLSVRGGFSLDDDQWGWFLLDYFLNPDFAEVIAATHRIFDLIDHVTDGADTPETTDGTDGAREGFRSVSLLGHSQGMAMASTAARLRPEAFRSVVGLSGFVLSNPLLASLDAPDDDVENTGPHPFFWGRDVDDVVIHPDAVNFTADWLEQHTRLTVRTYPEMGHGVGDELTRDVEMFLRQTLAASLD